MLRETYVAYSSLPKEEGDDTRVTTRTSGDARKFTKNRLITVIVILLIVLGVPVMIIAPLALSKASGRNNDVYSSFLHIGGEEKENALQNIHSAISNSTNYAPPVAINQTSMGNVTLRPPPSVPLFTNTTSTSSTTTLKSISSTTTSTTTTPPPTTTTSTTTTTTAPTTTTTTTTTPAPVITLPTTSLSKPTLKIPIGGNDKNQSGGAADTSETSESQKISEMVSEDGRSEVGKNDGVSHGMAYDVTTWMNTLMMEHEWWTVMGLVVAAVLAMAVLIITMVWIIQSRISLRRRKVNLEKVITDLQSRDKVVLLNSEDSDDEA